VRFAATLAGLILVASNAVASTPDATRAAVVRALPILQRSAATFVAKRSCVSCHHNVLPVMLLRLADRRGLPVDAGVIEAIETKTFRQLRSDTALDDAIQTAGLSDPTPNDSFVLMAAHDAGLPGDLITAVYARRLERWQLPDGRWMTSDFRPPHSSSEFTATASAVLALRAYMPEELAVERDAAIRRAITWLNRSWPRSTEDASFRLLGLVWSQAAPADIASAARALQAMQLSDGGWPQLPGYAADAYSTGEALFALRAGGMASSAKDWERGARFLITTQAADGTWRVRSRMLSPADISPPYFHTGFPYGHDEFLSYAGSAWAVMALLSSMPDAPPTLAPAASSSATAPPGWLRTALFGSVGDLTSLLDRGLDPNSKTNAGTTVLMASALDADKTRLLLARRADPRARGRSGADALTIAASHRNTYECVGDLIAAGADVQPPADVRVPRSAIVGAALAGDVDNVRLLLQRGAKPSSQAASEAITFGHTEVVRALIDAGADVTGVDRTGVNLLHWAAITNRAPLVPILAQAGVPVNAMDDHGYTPLMYAATVDEGDTATLQALLRAGANLALRNDEGRTALQQAQRLKHDDIVRALRNHGVADHGERGATK
jgi:ankyrin repeat protein